MYIYILIIMEKNNTVMLWGLEKASKSQLTPLEGKNNNPKSTSKLKKDKTDKKPKVERKYDITEDYGVEDLPFLKKEADRIEKEIDEDINYDENLDLQEKIMDLIDTLEEIKEKFTGKGLRPILESVEKPYEDVDSDTSDDEYGRGVEEPIARSRTKQIRIQGKALSKARMEKGSEEAKELGKRLAEARRMKREGKPTLKEQAEKKREEKEKTRHQKLKPWYYVGIIPKGYREATEDEAIRNYRVGSYGKYKVDIVKNEFFDKYKILLSHDMSNDDIKMALIGIPKKINRSFNEIEILENKLANNKYTEQQHHAYDNKLDEEKHTNKNLQKAYNWVSRLYAQRFDKPYTKRHFTPPKHNIIETKETVLKPEVYKETIMIEETPNKSKKSMVYKFDNAFDKISIPTKAFTEEMLVKPKFAQKLFEKSIILHPEHYHPEDIKKYFYSKTGTGIGSKDAQKLISLGYQPEMKDIDNYQLDRDLSVDRARVYRNTKTGKVYVVHRGTKEASDWLNNLVYGLSPYFYKHTDRYKQGKDVQEKALQKYGNNVDVIGHSQGAKIAEMASRGDKRVKDVITYNRPVGLQEAMTPLDKNVVDVRSSWDPVSMFAPFQKRHKPITIENKSWNPLQQHNTSSLLENPNVDFGSMSGEGIVDRKPPKEHLLEDIVQSVVFMKPKWKVSEAKKWLQKHGYHNDEVDEKPTQIRFRQYNPEDLRDRYYVTKKLKGDNILLIISKMSNKGTGIMLNNYEFLTPEEHRDVQYKEFFNALMKHKKTHESLEKEKKRVENVVRKATKARLAKGSQAAKDKMAAVRVAKKK
jgi:hypothetical protein